MLRFKGNRDELANFLKCLVKEYGETITIKELCEKIGG